MHVDFEGVGLRAGPKNGAGVQDNLPKRRGTKENPRRRSVTEDEDPDDDDDEDNAAVDSDDEPTEISGTRAREEEFAKLSEQFAERKNAIDAVMQLDDLSLALNSFHALPTPTLNLSSRSNTVSTEASVLPPPPLARREHNIGENLPNLSVSTNIPPSRNASHAPDKRREGLVGTDITPKLVDSPLSMQTEHYISVNTIQ